MHTYTALNEIIETSPIPNEEDGTNNVQIFLTAYVVNGAPEEDIKAYYSTGANNTKSKYYDVRNKDPRLFQMASIIINVVKPNLVPGFQPGLLGMRVGQRCVYLCMYVCMYVCIHTYDRRSIIIPAELAYGADGVTTAYIIHTYMHTYILQKERYHTSGACIRGRRS